MKRVLFTLCFVCASIGFLKAQSLNEDLYAPKFALKTNFLYWATTTPNLGMEFTLGRKTTMDISGNYNFWEFSDNKKFKHWLVQPEVRYWFCDRFNSHFMGIHGHYAEYNVGGIKALNMEHYRYQGNLFGGGLTYGYHWLLGDHWSIEAVVGIGYAHLKYDKYPCDKCGEKIKDGIRNYVGPTKLGVNLIYIIK
ncbi:MAG: DUF3575 domain-containing protein [Tannerellaceae bacterium]|nr:DUF3575 domain-containing protein [Tannerellaceae bacterium]